MQMRTVLFVFLQLCMLNAEAQDFTKGKLLYANSLSTLEDTTGWRMEGHGQVGFKDGWMTMHSPGEKGHHVFWCPQHFPGSFIAEWEVQNLNTSAGLCIVFFAAKGRDGEDIHAATLPKRNGKFSDYTKGAIDNYHISYHANAKNEPLREHANLRKNRGFHKVQSGEMGIPADSEAVHTVKLVKHRGRIILYVDARKVIDWEDDGVKWGKILEDGRIGFRQMKWTRFAYRNFNVWECEAGAEDGK